MSGSFGWLHDAIEAVNALVSIIIGTTPVVGGTPGDTLIVGPGGELEQTSATGRTRISGVTNFYVSNISGTIAGGTLYTAGRYTNVAMTGVAGAGLTADIIVAGGAVTAVSPHANGVGYAVGNVLSAASATIGGTGAGFTFTITAIGSDSANGLTPTTPWLTIQHAIDTVTANFFIAPEDTTTSAPFINLADGVYTNVIGLFLPSTVPMGVDLFYIQGNTASPASAIQVIINTTACFNAVINVKGSNWYMTGVTIDAANDAAPDASLVWVWPADGTLMLEQVNLGKAGNAGGGFHCAMFSDAGSASIMLQTINVIGIAQALMYIDGEHNASASGFYNHGLLTLSIDPLWPQGTVRLQGVGSFCSLQFTNGFTGTSSGPKATIDAGNTLVLPSIGWTGVPGTTIANKGFAYIYDASEFAYSHGTGLQVGDTSIDTGKIHLKGTTSGDLTLSIKDAAGTYILKLPDTIGTPGQVLSTDGVNQTSWIPAGGVATTPLPQWNPIAKGTHVTLSAGNSTATNDGTANSGTVFSVAGYSGGKWYAECKLITLETFSDTGFGLSRSGRSVNSPTVLGSDINSWAMIATYGFSYHNSSNGPAITAPTTGDVLQIAWDADTGNLFFGINNVWQNAANPVTETNPVFTGITGYMFLACSTFLSGGNSSSWGLQTLVYAPPQGYSPWSLAGAGAPGEAPANSVQYNNAGSIQGAANFNIFTGNPNVTAGNSYMYDGAEIIQAQVSLQNFYDGGSGNLTATGSTNTATGFSALAALTTGSGNMAVGTKALASCTTGGAHMAMGFQTLQHIIGGVSNVGLGGQSLQALSSGSGNLGVGAFAAYQITSGNDNIFFGGGTLATCSNTASENVLIGAAAVGSSNPANLLNCVVIGYFAGSNISGNDNICIGHKTGDTITTGPKNTIIGSQATSALITSPLATGGQNIVIGYECDVPLDASGQLSIGNYIYGTGLTGTGTSISTGFIGLGIKSPATELDVLGRVKTRVYSAATTVLPAAGNKGARAFVSDAVANTFNTPYVSGGAFNVPVFDDGTNWIIG